LIGPRAAIVIAAPATGAATYDRGVRIVHIESGRHFYGGARQVEYLLGGLARRGFDNVLICPPGHPLSRRDDLGRILEVPMHGDLDFAMVRRLRRAFARAQPDIVHVHSRRGADLYGGFASRLDHRRAVLTRRVQSAEPRFWARLKYRPYARIVAISGAVLAQLRDDVGLDPDRLETIASAVDTDVYRPDPRARARVLETFALGPEALVVGVAAQLIARKGHAFLFRALPAVVARHPQLRVLCFGRGPRSIELERLVGRLGLRANVRLAGFRDDLPALLPGLDLLVHTPEREGLGIAVLEAMSCEIPIVATEVGGIVGAVGDARQGLLLRYGDTAALVAALERLIADPHERRRLGQAGRIRVSSEFTVDLMTERYVEVYRNVPSAG